MAAERKRRQRERARSAALLYSRDDWELFLDIATLPQKKAGVQPRDLPKLVLKELADNALDASAARIALPENIESRLRRSLTARPELSWDAALADIIDRSNPE